MCVSVLAQGKEEIIEKDTHRNALVLVSMSVSLSLAVVKEIEL